MPSVVKCPSCSKTVSVEHELLGKLAICPHCSGYFSVAAEPETNALIAIAPPKADAARALRQFTFTCQRCGSILEAIREQCGQPGRCPTCGAVFVVPSVSARDGVARATAIVPDDGQLPTPVHAYATAGERAPKIIRREDGQQAIVCPRCRREMPVDADACRVCGIPFTLEGANPDGPVIEQVDNNLATAALTVGILAVLTFCLPVLALVAIGLGIYGLRQADKIGPTGAGRNMAITGIVLGVAALALFVSLRVLGKW